MATRVGAGGFSRSWSLFAVGALGLIAACAGKTHTQQDCTDYNACVNMGATARDRGDYPTAGTFYARACDMSLDGCVELGSFNEFFVLDPVAAEAAYKRACDGGSASGCYNMGMFYEYNAWGANYSRAQQAYQRACQLDYNYCTQ